MFEGVLSQNEKGRQSRRRLVTLPVALALHVLALAVVAAAQLWAVEDVQEPMVTGTLYLEPPPPPRGEAAPAHPEARSSGRRAAPSESSPPARIPESVPTPPPAANHEVEPMEGVPWGVPDGEPNGDPNGVPDGVPAPAAPPVEQPRGPIVVGGDVIAPVLVRKIDPVYPEPARIARRQGVVVVEAVLDGEGNVTDARVASDEVQFGAGEASLKAIRAWKYRPATSHGKAVSVYLTIRVAFHLN